MASLLFDRLKSEIATEGRTLAILGTGVSIGASGNDAVASWKGLLHHGVQRCLDLGCCSASVAERLRGQIEGDMIDLLCAAENVSQRLEAPGPEYRRWLRESVGSLTVKDDGVIRALKDLGVALATTNYDRLIEEVTLLRPVTWRDRDHVESFLRGNSYGVLHLHGYWEDASSVILGIRSYDEILRDKHAQEILRAIRLTRTVLYIGFGAGLSDLNFGAFLRWSGEVFADSQFPSYRLCLTGERDEVKKQHPSNQRIEVLEYGDSPASLPDYLRSLRSR